MIREITAAKKYFVCAWYYTNDSVYFRKPEVGDHYHSHYEDESGLVVVLPNN